MVKNAVIVEGKSDRAFIKLLINHLSFDEKTIQFYLMGGKSQFFQIESPRYKELSSLIKAEQISNVLFLLDSDNSESDTVYGGYENTQREINV